MAKTSGPTSFSEIRKRIAKEKGEGALRTIGSDFEDIKKIPTNVLALDNALRGGFPIGRIVELYGNYGCIAADVHLDYVIKDQSGRIQNAKGGSIERLYHRFHNIPMGGKGSYQRPQTINSDYYIASVDSEGRIYHNRIVDVFDSGVKPCLRVTTKGGLSITTTADHKFFDGKAYRRLSELGLGSNIMVHPTKHRKNSKARPRIDRSYLYVKSHPVAGVKVIKEKGKEYTYHRLARYRAVVEAAMNKLSLDTYVERLNTGELKGLTFLTKEQEVHHLDENPTNDELSNLQVLTKGEHDSEHFGDRFAYRVIPDEIIAIEPVGDHHTYDIEMAAPDHNFVAQRFVVHNSGKSGIAMQFLGSAQEHGICCYFDLENAFNPTHAENSGVNLDDLFFGEADSAEEILQMVDDLLDAQDVSAIVLDSVAGLIPQAKLNGDYGDAYVGTTARLMSDALPLLAQKLKKTETVLVFVNQVREKIGINGYGPSTSSMGGRALKFWSGVRIDVARIGSVKQGEDIIGQTVRAKLEKNRFAPPFQQATFDILYETGISNESTLMDLAVKAGFIEQKGAWFTIKSTGESVQGKPKVLQLLREDPELADELKGQIL